MTDKRQEKKYDIAIIGAGAAGLMAAITAARAGARPILLEHMEQAAKKLPATGNGRCNYTNAEQSLDNYYCDLPKFVEGILAQFSYEDTIRFFEGLGIPPLQKNGTCIYPESGQAAAVRQVLLAEVQRLEIPLAVSVGIRSIHRTGTAKRQGFEIRAKDRTIYSRTCILAAGGKSAKKTGSDGSGYLYGQQLGHTVIQPLPALVALQADLKKWKLPAGVRIACGASLLVDGRQTAYEQGELQITEQGISGIVVFQFSRIVSRALQERKDVRVCLDFKPGMEPEELCTYLTDRFRGIYHVKKTVLECLIGFLPDKLIPILIKRAQLAENTACTSCSREQILRVAGQIKNYVVKITGTKGFDQSQVTTGGICVEEIDPATMGSRLVPGLYFAGEIVDVDAKCGGYNLQWAWSSGYVAGKAAAGIREEV